MDRTDPQTRTERRKSVVILSERSREIIRLLEERQRKRQQASANPPMPSTGAFRPGSGGPSQPE